MKDKKVFTLSNLIYTSSLIFAVGVLVKTYIDRSKVPPGVCPIDDNRGLMILAIGILGFATIVTSVIDYRKKKKGLL